MFIYWTPTSKVEHIFWTLVIKQIHSVQNLLQFICSNSEHLFLECMLTHVAYVCVARPQWNNRVASCMYWQRLNTKVHHDVYVGFQSRLLCYASLLNINLIFNYTTEVWCKIAEVLQTSDIFKCIFLEGLYFVLMNFISVVQLIISRH